MTNLLIQLYPASHQAHELKGLYLGHDLRGKNTNKDVSISIPYVYTNFVTSLDGRIAIPAADKDSMVLPDSLGNDHDWRLFQELAAQADIIISSGRHVRDMAKGEAQEILNVENPKFADLKAWRKERGLSPQPDIAVVSNSLDFPIPKELIAKERRVLVFTGSEPDKDKVMKIEQQGGTVIVAGEDGVDGKKMVAYLGECGYQMVYSTAGPRVLHLLLAGRVLNRIYLTQIPRIFGGDPLSSIVQGGLLDPHVDLKLHTMYHDSTGADGLGQLFVAYDLQ